MVSQRRQDQLDLRRACLLQVFGRRGDDAVLDAPRNVAKPHAEDAKGFLARPHGAANADAVPDQRYIGRNAQAGQWLAKLLPQELSATNDRQVLHQLHERVVVVLCPDGNSCKACALHSVPVLLRRSAPGANDQSLPDAHLQAEPPGICRNAKRRGCLRLLRLLRPLVRLWGQRLPISSGEVFPEAPYRFSPRPRRRAAHRMACDLFDFIKIPQCPRRFLQTLLGRPRRPA